MSQSIQNESDDCKEEQTSGENIISVLGIFMFSVKKKYINIKSKKEEMKESDMEREKEENKDLFIFSS